MLTLEQKSEVYERVDHFVSMGNIALGLDMEGPHVRFDKKGRAAGTAYYSAHELNFNAQLLLDNWDEFMNQTIPHEVAHLLKHTKYGTERGNGMNSHHGYYWQHVMKLLGADPKRCHSMDTSKVRQAPAHKTKYIYVCPSCKTEMVISKVRHNKMLRGRTYSHSPCGRHAKIEYVRTLGKMSNKEAFDHIVPDWCKTETAAPAPAPAPAHQEAAKAPKAGTKIAHAIVIYKAMTEHEGANSTRQDIISALANSMQITKHAAAGYYQNCKKRIG